MKHIIMVASEGNPLCKSGGLADVIFSLSEELTKKGNKVAVILPFYKSIKDIRKLFKFVRTGHAVIEMSWRHQEAEFFRAEYKGLIYYLIGNHYYFDRDMLYGYEDDGERFAFFSLAALHLANSFQEIPDIIHVHDHQSAMIPCLKKEKGGAYPNLANTKTVLTIHNPAFKGYLNDDALGELFGLPHYLYDEGNVRFDGAVSTLKSGIMYADKIATVSPTHRLELLNPSTSMGLDSVLRLREDDFLGIVNGVDYEEFNPAHDSFLFSPYDHNNFAEGKAKNRARLVAQGELKDDGGPSFGMVSRLTSQKGLDLIIGAVEKIASEGHLVFILGSGDPYYENELQRLRDTYPTKFLFYRGYSNQVAHDIYASSDFFLMPSSFEPCGIGQLIALRYGTLPIARATGGLADTIVTDGEKADGFLFSDYSQYAFDEAINRAEQVYFEEKSMQKMIVSAMKADHSWGKSADEYIALYNQLC